MAKFIVVSSKENEIKGLAWYLRGTTWAGSTERADKFDSREAAQAALDRAKKFSVRRIYKDWFIRELGDVHV